MGYRSEVAYGVKVDDIVYSDDTPETKRIMSADGLFLLMLTEMQQDPIAGRCFDKTHEINEHLTIDKLNRTIVFHEHDLKWYESFIDVQAHERVYQIAEEYAEEYDGSEYVNNPVSCAFIRIGEEADDVEERGSGYDQWSVMNVYRGIEINI
jgi:hypothetical protein